ncbi:MAG: RidA family protein [Thermomicrobiales bacterium]
MDLDPDGLAKTDAYQQVAVSTGSCEEHVAGQVDTDATGQLVAPGDLAGQVAQVLRNVATGLAAGGATVADVAPLNVYVVDWQPEKMGEFMAGVMQVAGEIGFVPAPASLIEVVSLFAPGFLIEIEATAVLE